MYCDVVISFFLLGAAAHWASCSSSSVSSEPRFLLPNVLAVRRDDVGSKFPMLVGFLFQLSRSLPPVVGVLFVVVF
uniref:Putative secreted protein n=1 Tax=Ixodes ricinus TaxID=34613 RepID=A0A6B0U595_IXORI